MSDYSRRQFLSTLAAAPLVAAKPEAPRAPFPPELERAARVADAAVSAGAYQTAFFTPEEWETVRLLADLIIPADAEAGGALDAGVPEFIDFTLEDRPSLQVPVRGGLRWLDTECRRRFGQPFVACSPVQREQMVELIAWPDRAPAELSQGVAFFNQFRDLVASGYFTSRIGIEYLKYTGNTYVAEWTGCPTEALAAIGVSYEG